MKKRTEYLTSIGGVGALYIVMMILITVGVLNGYYTSILIAVSINIIAASSLNLATGFLGQLALGHAGFMAIGAYGAGHMAKIMESGLGTSDGISGIFILVVCLIFGGLLAGAAGILIGIPSLRLRGDYLGIVTLGFGEIIRISIYNIPAIGGAQTLKGIPKLVGFTEVFVLVCIVLAALYLLIRSRHGRAIMAIREDEIAAEAVGIPTTFYKVYGFAISAFFGGVAGGTLAFYQSIIDPKKFTFMFSVEIFIIVVLGGMGSLTGTVIAALLLGIISETLHAIDEWRLVIYAILLVVMMIFRPEGIMGTKEFSLVKTITNYREKRKNKKSQDQKA